MPWTGDADSGISSGRTLWAYHFGGSTATASVNFVSVPGLIGGNPSVAGKFSVTGVNGVIPSDSNDLTALGGQGSALLGSGFVYDGHPAVVTLQGLTAGLTYTATFLSVGWDDAHVRQNTFAVGTASQTLDQATYGPNKGIRVDCTFTATAGTQQITVTPPTGYTWHHYALALRVEASHVAYVFKTDNLPVPAETIAAIQAYGGPDTAIVTFGPGGGGTINGAPVTDIGTETLPRYDVVLGTVSGPSPQARHFIIAGDLTLSAQRSLWGTGGLLLKLEVLNNAVLQPGSLISVAAQGRIGGAGGGLGGLALPHPVHIDISGDLELDYDPNRALRHAFSYFLLRGSGGVTGDGGTGPQGNPSRSYYPWAPSPTQVVVAFDPAVYVCSIGGGDGTRGQGDSSASLGVSPGGAGTPYTGGYPGGGQGGAGGQAGASFPTSTSGSNGGVGSPGGDGVNGFDGGNGSLITLAGTVTHLRGGSGGGAGATGGHGLGGRSGGGGGGGGASGPDIFNSPTLSRGGKGGLPGYAGLPGSSGAGGSGGGGGGGILFIVRGTFVNAGTIAASGGTGIAGAVGTLGTTGAAGGAGDPGGADIGINLHGGNGGTGGKGGDGGRGGNGGNGASGSGGTIQIAASVYQASGAIFNVSGGTGAAAGLLQIHSYTGTTQNTPFGSFAGGLSAYRSYTFNGFVFPPRPDADPALVPFLPLEGGAATSGLGTQNFVSDTMLASLQPPTNAAAAVVRLPASAFFPEYPDHDLIVFTSLKAGYAVNGPRLSLVNATDALQANIGNGWVPAGPQSLLYGTADANNPAFLPGAPGPTIGPIPWNRGFMTLVEKGKPFEVTAEFGPYDFLRTFKGTPSLANVTAPGGYAGSAVFLYDKGRLRATVTGESTTNLGVILSESESETSTTVTGETFYRVGVAPAVRYSAANIGNAWSRAAGSYSMRYTPPGGSETTANFSFAAAAPGTPVFSRSITSAAGTVPDAQVLIGEFTLRPDYDFATPEPVVQQIYANVLGPQSALGGLVSTVFGPGVRFSTGSLSAVAQNIQITNNAPVRAGWQTFANANPAYTRLGIVSVSFTGANASAFAVSAPSALERGAAGSIAITFSPTNAGTYSATLRMVTDEGANNGGTGRTIDVPVTAFVGVLETYDSWASALPAGLRGRTADADGNGIANFLDYALRGAALPAITRSALPGGPLSTSLTFAIPVAGRSDVRWSISGSSDLQNWQPLAVRATAGAWTLANPADVLLEMISGGNRQLSFTPGGNRPRYFLRLNADEPAIAASYTNDFATEPRAALYGSAEWNSGGLRLTSEVNDQLGSAILNGIETWPGQTGFSATFNLTTGPGSIPNPADGVSFSVGDLPGDAWGEDGPESWESSRNLTIVFDTYGFNTGFETSRGIKIRVNGGLVLYSPVNPYSNGTPRAVEITYTPTEGLTVKFNGSNVFTGVNLGGFALQPGDRFGFGGRTGGLNQVSRIDDVNIQPR